ncbi:MAG: rhomboid family intramembrane serine protease [Gammaproteobacteria bacterium]|nr:rhomboid family intramembrane serine protease [Gammaproteobacteria bacterium]
MMRVRLLRFLVATVTAAAVFLGTSRWLDSLAFDRIAIIEGEYWRLGTSHLTHLDNMHGLMNALGVGLVTAVLLDFLRPARLLASAVTIAGTISGASVLLAVESTYAGASGILYGLAAIAVFALAKRTPRLATAVGVVLMAGVATAFADWHRAWTADVATHTHLIGMAAGAAIGVWVRRSAPAR